MKPTIPFIVMLTSVAIWLTLVLFPKISHPWLVEICRILFAASVLVVLWSVMNKEAFGG